MGAYLNGRGAPIRVEPAVIDAITAAQASTRGSIGPALFGHLLPGDDEAARDELEALTVQPGAQQLRSAVIALLTQAGYRPRRHGGVETFDDQGQPEWSGPITWEPRVPLPRVDDSDSDARRRLMGEVAIAAMLRASFLECSLPWTLIRHVNAPQTRGAQFKHAFAKYVASCLSDEWEVRSELPLDHIYGMHMRRDVGDRSSDIVVTGPPNRRLFAIISSKASWRSDRGTEGAAMVPLRRYRPDVPYVMVTAEFPRASQIIRESPEDRVYHLVPAIWAAWRAAILAYNSGVHIDSLQDLIMQSEQIRVGATIPDLDHLVSNLRDAAEVL